MSMRIAPVFSNPNDRGKVYMIYKKYEVMKKQSGDKDDIDRVVPLLRALEEDGVLKKHVQKTFDEVYVDGMI